MPVPEKVVRTVKREFVLEPTEAETAAIKTKPGPHYMPEHRAVVEEREKPCRSSRISYQLQRGFMSCFGSDRRA